MGRNKKGRESKIQGVFYEDLDPKEAPSPYHAWYYTPKIGKNGKKISRPVHAWFKSKRKRDDWAKEVDATRKNLGIHSNALDKSRLKLWERADAMLDPWENPIDVVRQWRENHPKIGQPPKKKKSRGITAARVIEIFFESRKDDPTFEINQYRSHCDRFLAKFGEESVDDLFKRRKEIATWIENLEGSRYTRRNQKSRVAVAFSEGKKNDLFERNPFERLEVNIGDIEPENEFLSVDDCIEVFAANFDNPGLCAKLSLGLHGGLRSSAVSRVEYCDFRFSLKALETPAWKTKTNKRDLLQGWPEVVWQWVDRASENDFAPACQTLSDKIELKRARALWKKRVGRKWSKAKSNALKRADLLVTADDKICKEGKATPKAPPSNWARHSFATYHATAYEDLAKTATLMSHAETVQTLKRHYLGAVEKPEAERFFQITPDFIRSLLEKKI